MNVSNATSANHIPTNMGSLKMKTGNNEHTLPFQQEHITQVIKDQEEAIPRLMSRVEESHQSFKNVEEPYLRFKQEYEQLSRELEVRKEILEAHVRMRENTSDKKLVRVLRATSNLDTQRGKHKEIKWIEPAVETLRKLGGFLPSNQLFDKILELYPDIKKKMTDQKNLANFRVKVAGNLVLAAEKERKRGVSPLVTYKGKLGLVEWVDETKTPQPHFMTAFVHGEDKVHETHLIKPHNHHRATAN